MVCQMSAPLWLCTLQTEKQKGKRQVHDCWVKFLIVCAFGHKEKKKGKRRKGEHLFPTKKKQQNTKRNRHTNLWTSVLLFHHIKEKCGLVLLTLIAFSPTTSQQNSYNQPNELFFPTFPSNTGPGTPWEWHAQMLFPQNHILWRLLELHLAITALSIKFSAICFLVKIHVFLWMSICEDISASKKLFTQRTKMKETHISATRTKEKTKKCNFLAFVIGRKTIFFCFDTGTSLHLSRVPLWVVKQERTTRKLWGCSSDKTKHGFAQ